MSDERTKRVSREAPARKTCPRCTIEKDIEEFAINRATPTGRDYICKQCATDAAAERLRRKRAAEGREVGIYQKAEDVLAAGEKRCGSCKKTLPLDDFRKDGKRKDGRKAECRACEKGNANVRNRAKADERRHREGKPTTKLCVVCHVEKHRDDFDRIKGGDGRMAWCSECGAIPIPEGTKRCTVCGEAKPPEEFYSSTHSKAGRTPDCQDCKRAYGRRYGQSERGQAVRAKWDAENEEFIKEYHREYAATHPEETLARGRKHREANREALNAAARARRLIDIEATHAKERAYAKANPESWRAASRRRRARMLEVGFEEFPESETYERDGWICQICLEPVDPDIEAKAARSKTEDHLVALSMGGPHFRVNVMLAHLKCNQDRYWRARRMLRELDTTAEDEIATGKYDACFVRSDSESAAA